MTRIIKDRKDKEATGLFRYIVISPTCDVRFDPVKMALGLIEGKEAKKNNRNLGHILCFLRDRYTIFR